MAGQRTVAEGIRHRAWLSDSPSWLLGTAVGQGVVRAQLVAGAGGAGGTFGGYDQPVQRAWLDVELAERGAGQLAGRTDARAVMELSADAIWLATAAVDTRCSSSGALPRISASITYSSAIRRNVSVVMADGLAEFKP